jgi:hypothetical protein
MTMFGRRAASAAEAMAGAASVATMPTIPSIRCKRVKAPGLLLCFISFAPFSVGLDPALIYI